MCCFVKRGYSSNVNVVSKWSKYANRLANYLAYECAVVVLSSAVARRDRKNELFSLVERKVYLIVVGSAASDFGGVVAANRNRFGAGNVLLSMLEMYH